MKYKKIVSFICLTAIFSQNIPFDLLSYANEISKIENIENTKEESDSTKEDKVSDTKVDTDEIATKTEENKDTNVEENKVSIESYAFNAYIDGENELAFSLGFDTKEGKFIVKDRADKELSNKNPDSIMYKINVYDKENKEKIAIELTGKDKGISDKLDILNESKYEIGDFIQIIPMNSKEGLKITGDIQGDINKEKEDYSDGIDEPDYIQNVRFEITEEGLKSVYNEAPVINGLSDIKDANDKNINIFEGISVTDDHDKEIDTSTIQTEVKQIDELSAEITYTATDSWGRKSSGSRIISGVNPKHYTGTNFSNQNSENTSLKDLVISVGGITYAGGQDTRFKLKFDVPSSTIKVIDVDSRVMHNRLDGDYFKFELYDKEMNLKKSVTLLGKDKSNSDKVKELNNLKYVNGDHIYIWHRESSEKLKITGNIEDATTENGSTENRTDENSNPGNKLDYSNGVTEENLINHRFEITAKGLKRIKNEAPKISGLQQITVERGGTIDYWPSGIRITDDKDEFTDVTVNSGKVSVHHTEVDTSKLGTHTVVYTATDSWGLSGTAETTVTVSGTNPIESKFIEVYNKQKELAFKIGFDSVSKTYIIRDQKEGTQLNPTTDNIVFKFRVFSEDGKLKKTVNIKGKDKINKRILSKIDGFKYEEGDYIELWSEDSKNGIKIIGGLENTKIENKGSEDIGSGNTEPINTENNQNIDLSRGIPEDYSDGIDNPDYMNNVRFRILPNSLKVIYNKAPEINFEEMTVKRGEDVDYLNGVTVGDDHDMDDEKLKAKVIYKKINTNTTGSKSIEYRLTDSWGRTTIKNRDITVTDKTALEANKINIKGNDGVIFSLGFDSINKKYIVRDINLNNLPDNVNDDVFKMTVYTKNTTKTNTNGDFTVKHNEITITADDLQNKRFVTKFEELSFADDDYISLWSYDHQNGIEVKLNKNNKSSKNNEDNTYTFENEDKMYNTRFKINEYSGLEKIYNAAPEINGVDTDFYILKGSDINLESVATVSDDHDNDITSKLNTTGLEKVDKTTVGTYPVHYEVSDSWGRTTSKDVNMHVVSNSVSNDIEFYSTDDRQKIFSLKYNPMKNKFDVKKTDTESTLPTNTDATSTDDTANGGTTNDGTAATDKVFGLTVFNKKSEEIHKIELNESEVQDINRLNEISTFDIQDGYYFSIWSNTPKRIKITGNMIGNRGRDKEDYTDGIDNDDQMINVRFKITETGLQHIYNEAPIINGIKNLEAYAGDPIEYLNNITVTDTLDGEIDKNKIKITNGENKPLDNKNDEGKLNIGENTINYTVEDSWGRTTTIETSLNIKEGMGKNSIVLQGGPNEQTHNDILTIEFDTDTKKIKLKQQEDVFNNNLRDDRYYQIKIFGKNGSQKLDTGRILGSDKGTSEKFNELKEYTFNYGDRFEIFAWHPYRVKMDGKIIDGREDYTDGINIPFNLKNAKFEITHSGLKSIYSNNNILPENTNKLGIISPEGYSFQYEFTQEDGKIKATFKQSPYAILYGTNDNVLRLGIYNKFGDEKSVKDYKGSEAPKLSNHQLKDVTIEYGDYLYVQHKDPKRVDIYGSVINSKEDYTDGFENEIDMRNTIFRFTENGLEAVYNNAPVINGIEDTVVYLNEDFRPLENVSITDEDKYLRVPEVVENTVDTSEVGEYKVEYRVVDSWGRETTENRKVTVVQKIYDNRFKIYSDSNLDNNEGSDSSSQSGTDIDVTNAVDGGDSSDNQSGTENSTKEPIFEIGFDPLTKKYKVYNQKVDKLSEKDLNDTAFYIEIRNSSGQTKTKVILKDNDRGTSPKLELINETYYEIGDTIQVYRRDHENGIKITGKIDGDVDTNKEDYSDGINDTNYMNNVRFTVKEDKLETVYNNAPEITGGSSKGTTIIKGNNIDLLDGVQVSDDKDTTLSPDNIKIYLNKEPIDRNYKFDKIGQYKLHFMLVDSWGRATLIEVDISVESKVKLNDIKVYNNDQLGLTIGFDTSKDNIIVKEVSTKTDNTVKSSNNDTAHFTMTVRDKKGVEKYSIALNGDTSHDRSELAKIHQKDYSKYDTISLKGANHNDVKITGDIVGNSIDYSNGFGTNEKYTQVRFMITDDGLKELKTDVPTLTGIGEVTVKRGEEIDFMDGVQAETGDVSDEDYTITVNQNGFNKMLEGTYTVKYKVTTKRGVEATYDRKVVVEPRNELEKVKLKINKGSSHSSENILTIGFDTITNKLRVINHSTTDTMPGSSSEVALRLSAYDALGSNISNIELRGGSTIDGDFLTRVNNFEYQEGQSLSIWYKDYQNMVIEGNIESDTEKNKTNYNQGIVNTAQIQNVRFSIKEEELKYVYNEAPVITGHNEALIYYKGQILDPFKDINITDDHDVNISIHDITYDDTKVDLDEPGSYTMKYIAEDSWGRTAEYERTIIVKSGLGLNKIEIHSLNNTGRVKRNTTDRKVFDIGFDDGKVKIENKSNNKLDSTKPNDDVVTIKIYNKSMNTVKDVTLTGNDNGNSPKLSTLEDYPIKADDFISIENISDDFAQNGIKITGDVLNQKEDYSDGINDMDNINNVRFNSTEFGLQSVYNEAPIITFNGELDALLGDGIDDIDFMVGTTITDDHDRLVRDNITVTGLDGNENTAGTYTVTYEVTDLWGRSTFATRKVKLSNALHRDIIQFMGHREPNDYNNAEVALEMGFDTKNQNDMKIKVSSGEDMYFRNDNKNINEYKVQLLDQSGKKIKEVSAKGGKKANEADVGLKELNDQTFEYGYKIKFFAWHQDFLRIQGPVRNAREDYSDGVQQGDSYTAVTFEITKSGLKSHYEPDQNFNRDKVNVIAPSAREGYPFKLKIDANTKAYSFYDQKGYAIEYGTTETALKIILYGSDGIVKFNVNLNGGLTGTQVGQNDGTFEYGDYITVWHRTPKNLSIQGNIINKKEDYSDGIDDEEYMNHVVFKLTEEGMKSIYMAPPTIDGVKDRVYLKGDLVDDNDLKTNVTATDTEGNDLTNSITMTHDINTEHAGLYDITYSVTDSNNVSASVKSTVQVQAKPEIYVNRGRETIELNSLTNLTEEEIEARLKDVVIVRDEEDDEFNKTGKLEIVYDKKSLVDSTKLGGTTTVKYKATDSDGNTTEKDVVVTIIRTINVSVPTVIPFQVVTNLKKKENEEESSDPFVSGILKLKNNNTSDVQVSLKSFNKQSGSGALELVNPNTSNIDWENLSSDETMRKMALGMYHKSGLNSPQSAISSKESPLWLTDGMNTEQRLGILPRAVKISEPSEAKLTFTSKHGKNFKGGTSRGKFDLIFKFE